MNSVDKLLPSLVLCLFKVPVLDHFGRPIHVSNEYKSLNSPFNYTVFIGTVAFKVVEVN